MSAIDRITLVLRPHVGTTIEELQQYAKVGMPVGIGRSLGVIVCASEGDVMKRVEQLENQVILAEAAMRRGVQIPAPVDLQHIDERIKQAADAVDPRNLFITINPIGASPDELEKGRSGFVDERTHGDYLIFLAGYRAALEVEPCEA